MQTFYLIRHGQKEPTAGEPGLTELGHQQAKATAQYLAELPIHKIFSSPSTRTQQTAEHIANATKLTIEFDELLRERVNWGDDPQQSLSQFLDMWGRSTQDRNYVPPVGDTSIQAGQRMEQMVELIRKDASVHQHVVLVTHGGIIGDFLRNIFGDTQMRAMMKEFQHHQHGDYKIRECSITVITFEKNVPTLTQLASVQHLLAQKLVPL